jgi:hypothetical protein
MKNNIKRSPRNHKFLANHKTRDVAILVVILFVVLIVGIAGILSGWVPYTASLIKCGKKPIITSRFLESATYARPGDPEYGHGLFSDHYLCSEQEAVNLGYSGPEGSLSNKQYLQRQAQADEAAIFSPSKISFVAYSPSYLPPGYTKDIPKIEDIHGKQVLQYLKLGDKLTILIRQGSRGSSYAACSLDPCTAASKNTSGDIIYRSYSPNNGSIFWGIELQDSFINIETNSGFDLSVSDVTQMFSTLQALK